MNATGQTTVVQKTIAIIDDEPDNLTVLEDSLSRAGYRVEAFPRGELAIAGACEEPPDLVLLDIRMPGMDGYEVCRRFKADERLKTIPIIFISALSAVEDIATGFKCGGVDYVTKPFREPELLARVSSHLALRAAHLQVEEQHEKLLTLEKHRDTLVHMMVHDLRRPLTVIYGCLQIMELRSDRSLDETDLAILSDAVHGVERLSNMITTVIDLNRMENAEIPLNRLAVTVDKILEGACAMVSDPSHPRDIVRQIADHCPEVLCDERLTERVIGNIITNAIHYSPASGEIVLGAAPDPAGIRIWVRDQGSGISAINQQRIFDKFGMIASATDKHVPSTGLGLAFCKLAVESQGGTIGVESEPGKGSTFWFTLPAARSTSGD